MGKVFEVVREQNCDTLEELINVLTDAYNQNGQPDLPLGFTVMVSKDVESDYTKINIY